MSNDTIDVQNMDLPQSTSELKEMNDATVEYESLEHESISLPTESQTKTFLS